MTVVKPSSETDAAVRAHIYAGFVRAGKPPSPAETAAALTLPLPEVERSYQRLRDARVIVLEDSSLAVRMAFPFSAAPTPFVVATGGRSYFGNCAWDALGIPALLHQDARISMRCGDCDDRLELVVTDGVVGGDECLAHFAVPAGSWWEDVTFT